MVITEAADVPEPNDDRLSARTLLAEKSDRFASKFILLVIPYHRRCRPDDVTEVEIIEEISPNRAVLVLRVLAMYQQYGSLSATHEKYKWSLCACHRNHD